jgi:hypothetical protein
MTVLLVGRWRYLCCRLFCSCETGSSQRTREDMPPLSAFGRIIPLLPGGRICHRPEFTREILRRTVPSKDKAITDWSRGRKYLHTLDEASEQCADGRRRKNFRFIAIIMRNAARYTHTPVNWTPGGNPDPISDHVASIMLGNLYRVWQPKPNLRRKTTSRLPALQAQSHGGTLSGFS